MPQIFYIEADEEIISVVDRLRKSREHENVFVFPQGAFVLRSIVNLRLFDREAKKRDKSVSIVTTDELGRTMAEKVGIPVRSHLEAINDQMMIASVHDESSDDAPTAEPVSHEPMRPKRTNFGSDDFFGAANFPQEQVTETLMEADAYAQPQSFPSVPPVEDRQPVPAERKIPFPTRPDTFEPVRRGPDPAPAIVVPVPSPRVIHTDSIRRVTVKDRSPKNLTALNSQTEAPAVEPKQPTIQPPSQQELRTTQLPQLSREPLRERLSSAVMPVHPTLPEAQVSPFTAPMTLVSQTPTPLIPKPSPVKSPQEVVVDKNVAAFFSQLASFPGVPEPPKPIIPKKALPKLPPREIPPTKKEADRSLGVWLTVVVGIVLLVGLGVGAIIVLPRADITVVLKTTKAESDMRFEAGTPNFRSSDQTRQLQTRIIQSEKTVSQSFDTTGSGTSATARAQGHVTISNSYSTEPQTLVATTRILSSDGKLFRLKETVTVPGMKTANGQTVPGTIGADVVADQPGSAYNIDATTFTIPGFSSTSKQGKFQVASDKPFVGGGSSATGTIQTIAASDVLKAKQTVEAAAKQQIIDDLRSQLADGELLIPDATEITIVASSSTPPTGVAAAKFDYRVDIKARTLTFSESDVRDMILARFLAQAGAEKHLTADAKDMTLEYSQPDVDFNQGVLRFSVHAKAVLQPMASIESLKQEFLGKNASDLKSIVAQHPEISTIEVQFGNFSLLDRVPTRASQVVVVLRYATGN